MKPVAGGVFKELLLLLLLAALWGSSYLFIKIAVTEIPPITLIAARVSIAAFILILIVIYQGHRLPRKAGIWGALFLQSFLNSIGAWTVLAWGQQYVPSGLAGVLNSTSPIFVFFMTLLLTRHEAAGPWKLLGAILGMIGVTLTVGVDVLADLGNAVLPQLAVITGALLYAMAAIYGRRFTGIPPTVTASCTMLCATLCLIPVSIAVDQPWDLSPSRAALGAALALAIFCTALALLLYFRLVQTLGSMGVASQSYLRAGISVLLGIVVLGETLTPPIAAGLGLTLLGVATINLVPDGKRRRL